MTSTLQDDQYVWIGAATGGWGTASNWKDVTTNQSPASVPPGANDAVTIPAAANNATQTIPGTGTSLSLTLNGPTTLAGTFSTGALIENGVLTLGSGNSLAVSGNAVENTSLIVNGGTLAVGGTLTDTSALLAENGGSVKATSLALSGFTSTVTAQSGGSIKLSGLTLSNTFSTRAFDSLTVDATSSIEIGTAGAATAGQLVVDSGVTVTVPAATPGTGGVALSLSASAIVNNGTIVDNGILNLSVGSGGVGGTGSFQIGANASLNANGSFGAGTQNTIAFTGSNAALNLGGVSLDNASHFDPAISGFGANDVIDFTVSAFGAKPVNGVSYSGTTSSGTLTLLSGANTIATLTLLGDYTGATFFAIPTTGSTSEIVVGGQGDTATPPAGTNTRDNYTWNGPIAGSWDLAANWSDTTTGANPASVPPGANDAVTIPAASNAVSAITGTGNSLTLTIGGATDLAGKFSTGALGANGALTIGSGGSLTVSGDATGNASLTVNGGTLAVGGTLSENGGLLAENNASVQATAMAMGGGSSNISAQAGGSINISGLVLANGVVGNASDIISVVDATSVIEIGAAGAAASGTLTIDSGIAVTVPAGVAPASPVALTLIAPSIVNNGVIVDNGTLTLSPGSGGIGGTGRIEIGANATLNANGSFGTATKNTIAFVGADAVLGIGSVSLDGAGHFDPVISGFGSSDVIDYTVSGGLAVNGASYSGTASSGTLTLRSGATAVATLTLSGNYTGTTFQAAAITSTMTAISFSNGPPPVPLLLGLTVGSDQAAQGEGMSASGTGDVGDTVTLYDGAAVVGTAPVASDGTWSITPTSPFASGAHTLSVTETNSLAAISAHSDALQFAVHLGAPNSITFLGPAEANLFAGGAGNDVFLFTAVNLTAADSVTGGPGADQLLMTTAGIVDVSGVSGVETYTLAGGGSNTLTLANNNFSGITGTTITVTGGAGGNTVDASQVTGTNSVVLLGASGHDVLKGGAGNDVFQFAAATLAATDTVQGGLGTDQLLMTSAGAVAVLGVSGVETYTLASNAANTLTLTNANFTGVTGATITVTGGAGGNTIDASQVTGTNSVVLVGASGQDVLTGGAGNDVFQFAAATLAATDTIQGGLGTDQLMMTSAGVVTVSGVSGVETYTLASGGANTLVLADSNFAGITGTTITVNGGSAGNTLNAAALSPANSVVFNGGTGNDVFVFAAANLTAADVVSGGGGADQLTLTTSGTINTTGVKGVETYALASIAANTLTLFNGNFTGVAGTTITVNGGNAGNTVNATVLLASNSVVLNGGTGNDVFIFSAASLTASDVVAGGGGVDQLTLTTAGTINVNGVRAVETYALVGGAANVLTLTNANFVNVNNATITVNGGAAGNTIDASQVTGTNRVIVAGGAGHDVLTGGAGNDVFKFAAAALVATDTVQGGLGVDQLLMTSAGVVTVFGVSGIETYTLASTGANSLVLTDGNFTGITGSRITVSGGSAGSTLNAAALSPAHSVTLNGGNGNDVFVFSAASLTAADVVAGGAGTDQLTLTTSGTLAVSGVRGVETYALASTGANTLVLANGNFTAVTGSKITVLGGSAGNTENAAALAATNSVVLSGGTGNDVFVFSAGSLTASDVVAGGGGADQLTLTTSGTINTTGVRGVETYALASTGANSLTLLNGNFTSVTGATITVNGGNAGNTLNAAALAAADSVVLNGGAGNDTFIFSTVSLTAADLVAGGGGTADRLTLTTPGTINVSGVSGVETYALAGTGANTLTLADGNFAGVSGSKITVLGGNAGNTEDASALSPGNSVVLNGGTGNDAFTFSAASLTAADVVAGGSGADQLTLTTSGTINVGGVRAVETYTLASTGANSLTLTNANFLNVNSATITVNGGSVGDTIDDSAVTGANKLVFAGGAGADIIKAGATATMAGGGGANQFIFSAVGNHTISDFATSASNAIVFRNSGFDLGVDNGQGSGFLDASLFVANTTGTFTTTSQRFAYNTTGGGLFYDPDGSGTQFGKTAVALLSDHATLSAGATGNLFFVA